MRIILLSIAFLFLAFSAHSQVLKSAGVWYFLDVDSMTARPAVLPNGTELAYVVGTKKIYYWDRTTSTWTEYSTGGGSSFNRDSIYFDASIIGSGTVSDPWGVDSTLFATIAAVGDSIAAAVANYFPLEGGTLTGTGGAGFLGLPAQSGTPSTPASGFRLFANGAHNLAILDRNGWITTFDISATANRDFTYPSTGGTFALGTGTADRSARWSATNTLAAGNITDNGTKLQALLPWQFQTYTTAGLPTGVTGYTLYNTDIGGIGWYDGSRYNYVPKAVKSAFTSTYIPHTSSSGQFTESSNLRFESDYRLILNHTTYNNIIGRDAGKTTATGTFNNVMGGLAGTSLTSGQRNNFFGAASGFSITSGSYNVFMGNGNGNSSTTASYNVFLGDQSGFFNTTGSNNVFAGREAGYANTTADNNIAIGREAGRNNQTGLNNISIGYFAGKANTASGNIFIGEEAGLSNTTGTPNFFMGYRAGRLNTTGIFNFIAGSQSGVSNTTGSYNLFLGPNVGFSNTTGNRNIFIGLSAGNLSTIGGDNVCIGAESGFVAVASIGNTLIGNNSGHYIKNGLYNTMVGFDAGNSGVTTDTLGGDRNTLIGYQAGKNIKTDADRNIAIGNVDLPSATGDNQLTIGNAIFGTGLTGTGTTIAGKIGIKTASPFRDFEVNGEVRITDLTTDSPTQVIGADADGDIGAVGLSGGLSMSGGTLSSTWLKPELNAANVDINANAHELRIDSLSDLLISSPSTSTLGGAGIEQIKWLNTAKTKYYNRRLHYDSRALISGGMPAFYNLLTTNKGSGEGYEWSNEMIWDTTNNVFLYGYGGRYGLGYLKFNATRSNAAGVYLTQPRFFFFGSGSAENETANTYHTLWGSDNSVVNMMMGLKDGGKFLIAADSTMIFDPAIDVPQFNKMGAGNKEASDLSKTQSAYIAGFATDGTLLDYPISGLGNGIYSGSATLVNHTTRARVPDDGNLLFSQTFNGGADSSFFYFANATSGERYVGLGMTDTASTGGASLLIGNDGGGGMSFELVTNDAVNGNTQIRGVNGDLNLSSSAGNVSLSTNVANEVRVTGLIRSKQEAYYEITSTSSPQTFSNDYSDNFVNQGGTQASFTFLFPASPEDGQILSMTWNNAISTLTLDGNGNTITGTAVTTAVAGTRRQFKYYASASAWIKIY